MPQPIVTQSDKIIEATALAGSVPDAAYDLSLWGLFMQADFLVKGILMLLFFLSVWCWAIIFDKYRRLKQLKKMANDFEQQFWSGTSLERLYDMVRNDESNPISGVFSSGMREWKLSLEKGLVSSEDMKISLKQRVERMMNLAIGKEMDLIEKSMNFLASVGSVAPFIGLFGTVWGIMTSFQSIAISKNTSLAVVAPGIAEALLATALGLVAAIPAVLAYNKFSHEIARYGARLENFVDEFMSILSRYLEEQK